MDEAGALLVLTASGVCQGWSIAPTVVRKAFGATAMGGGWQALSTAPAATPGSHTGDVTLTVGVSEFEELLLRLALHVLG